MEPDAASLSDDELKNVIETGELPTAPESQENPTEEAPEHDDAPTEEAESAEPDEESEGETPADEPAERPISRREQLRINDLLKKYPNLRDRAEQRQTTAPKQEPSDFIKNLDADPEVIERLEQERQAASDKAFNEGLRLLEAQEKALEVREWKRDLKYETPTVLKEYPFLNPSDSENFRPAAAEAMNQKYLRFIGYNPGDPERGIPESVLYPDLSYREFIEGEMEFVEELASQKAAESQKNIVTQAATTGLRPDGSSAKRLNLNQRPEDMSIEELYAAIGQTPPKK